MTINLFWIASTILVLTCAAAIAYPILRNGNASSATRSRGRLLAIGLTLGVAIAAALLYARYGTPTALTRPENLASTMPAGPVASDRPHVGDGMDLLADRLRKRIDAGGGSAEDWALLARSYVELRRFDDATFAFSRATETITNDARLFADYADAMAMSRNGQLSGEPAKLIERALALDSHDEKAQMLAASAAFERRDLPLAIEHWEKLAVSLPKDAPMATEVANNLAEAHALLGSASTVAGAQRIAPATPVIAQGKAVVSGTVTIAAELATQLSPDDTLFVYARSSQGSPMPLAIIRSRADALPFEFTLDDTMAMQPGATLSGHKEITLIARISASGNAMPQPGDLTGTLENVAVGGPAVAIRIDTRRP